MVTIANIGVKPRATGTDVSVAGLQVDTPIKGRAGGGVRVEPLARAGEPGISHPGHHQHKQPVCWRHLVEKIPSPQTPH